MRQTPRGGGVPISHNALQHYPEFHGADTWGGGTLPGPARGVPCRGGGTLLGGTLPGGIPCLGGTLLEGYQGRVPPWPGQDGGVPCWGGTQVGQQKEYSLHGGRYASCVHAGGLSCKVMFLAKNFGISSHTKGKIL